ncbi:MAG: RluA family pseudouridine synthase, partial [Actinomycetota bacterium]
MPDTRHLPVPDALVGERADVALARMLGLSRSRAAEIAEAGGVWQDGREIGKSDRLADGVVMVELPDARAAVPEPPVPGGLRLVYEDADLAVVDKPVGVAAHAAVGWTGPTVVGSLAAAGVTLASSGVAERQGIVHRLDVGTSGLMVVAKSDVAYTVLKRAFKERTIEKIYHAVTQGHPDPTAGTIDAPIGRHPSSDFKFAVVEGGRPS